MAVKQTKAEKKVVYDQKLCQLLDEYTQILIAAADNVGSNQLQSIRKGLRGDSVVLMGKNTMMKRSIRMHSEKTGNKAFLNLIPLLVPSLDSIGIVAVSRNYSGVAARACGFVTLKPTKMMLPESITSTMPPNNECGEEEDEWSGDNEREQDGKEVTEICEDIVEEPKEGMTFDTSEDAYLFYCRYAKKKGFSVCRRTSRKGSDGKLKDITLSCSRAGKARVKTSNPVKPRPQSRMNCPAHIRVVNRDGKFNLNRVVLNHNHEQSPGKARYFKSNRVLDEHAKRKLELNDKAGIKMHKTYDLLQIEAGGHDKLPYLKEGLPELFGQTKTVTTCGGRC
ncbi:protein FAR1-RELATED SEQUENCE 11-like isoform X1 [Actinidia eriantha]|uniref:protein FAR1-RELATED SEQUENCE 11-like isoform X1 n=1 Tax=Actinidia eriantha TaxID=165200 RepID=UPI002582929E|nr:protein FAR1-RELATED SEQUENCE 11-like isoform X1 [Actinidia eriantha]